MYSVTETVFIIKTLFFLINVLVHSLNYADKKEQQQNDSFSTAVLKAKIRREYAIAD